MVPVNSSASKVCDLLNVKMMLFVAKTIPSVCVVLEGGPGTLKTVKSAIESGTPAVIVEVGFGSHFI